MIDSLFLKSSRNINSPGGGKSGANTLAINHIMLISGESHLMLLEMNYDNLIGQKAITFIQLRKRLFFNQWMHYLGTFVVLPLLERIYKSHSQRQNTCLTDKQPIDHGKSSVAKLLELWLAASLANACARWSAPDTAAVSVLSRPSRMVKATWNTLNKLHNVV